MEGTGKINQAYDPRRRSESLISIGDQSGGIYIDQAFEHMCSGRLGRLVWRSLSERGKREIMRREWEYGIKPLFRPGTQSEYVVSLPAELVINTPGFRSINLKREPCIKEGRIHFLE